MAKKDARIRFLERELAEREKEVETMAEQSTEPVVEDERMRDLERKVRELEALLKGLTAEVLDLKSVTMNLFREMEERKARPAVPEARTAPVTLQAEPRIAAEPRTHTRPRAPVPAAEKRPAAKEENLELIMQNNGTLKPEARKPSEYIVASTKFEDTPVKGRGRKGKQSDRTVFVEQKKRKVEDVIQAEEDDTLDLDR